MTVQEWITLVGVGMSVIVSVTPWMFAVHTRLAVIANQVEQLCQKLEKLANSHDQRMAMCIEHQSRLEMQDVRIAELGNRLREMT